MRWWRRFDNSEGGDEAGEPAAAGRARRASQRISESLRVAIRCASWPDLANLFTGNLSEGGLFVRGHEIAPVGSVVRIELQLPSGATLALSGRIANVVTPAESANRGVAPGMGVALDPLEGEARAAFDKLLATARRHLPRPADSLVHNLAAPPRPPRPSSIAPTDDVRHSVVMRAVEQTDVGDEDSIPEAMPSSRAAAPPRSTAPRRRPPGPGGLSIGIDLGVSNTTVTALVGTKVAVLARDGGPRHIPSVVHVAADGHLIAGEAARAQLLAAPERTIPGPKRLLGLALADPEAKRFLDSRPLPRHEMADGTAAVMLDERAYTGVEMCAALLAEARALAVEVLGAPVDQAVVSVPLRWNEVRIDALRRAGELAGLDVVAVVDEPTAVALANRFDKDFGGMIGVFDLGGSSCDFSVLNASRADLRLLATAGDATIGCDHIDEVLARAAAEHFQRRHQVDLERVPGAWARLLAACEQAKQVLSLADSASIAVRAIAQRGGVPLDLGLRLDADLMARAAAPLLDRAVAHCERALELADLAPEQLTAIYLSGGGSNLKPVRDALTALFGRTPRVGVQPELAIAIGAAMHAARLHFEGRPPP